MNDLIMMVPSRGRPESIRRLHEAWTSTTTGNSHLIVLVDDDDPKLDEYLLIDGVDIRVGPRLRIGGTLNHYAPLLAEEAFALGFMGDDHVPRTHGWDERFISCLKEMKTGLVYGNDLLQGERLPTAVAMTSDIVTTIGYFVMPGGIHLFLDDFWLAIGRGLERITYLPDVIIEHVHPSLGKSDWDQTYSEANSVWALDQATFNAYIANAYQVDLAKLKALL